MKHTSADYTFCPTVIFLAFVGSKHSRTRNYYTGLSKLGYKVDWIDLKPKGIFFEIFKLRRRLLSPEVILVVSSPYHILVPVCRIILRRHVFLDAGWPLSDGVASSRKEYGFLGIQLIKTYLIDFLAFHFAFLILLESEKQIDFCSRKFWVSKNKLRCLYTGVDESRFHLSNPNPNRKMSKTFIIFRGGDQPEAGLELLEQATTQLEDSLGSLDIQVFSHNLKSHRLFGENVSITRKYVPDDVLSNFYAHSLIVLGQLSNHERLGRTIPHKFFEAAYFGLPYLSSATPIMQSFAERGEIFTFDANLLSSFASVVQKLVEDRDLCEEVGKRLRKRFELEFSQEVLSKRLIEILIAGNSRRPSFP